MHEKNNVVADERSEDDTSGQICRRSNGTKANSEWWWPKSVPRCYTLLYIDNIKTPGTYVHVYTIYMKKNTPGRARIIAKKEAYPEKSYE